MSQRALFKTTIVIWSDYDPREAQMEIVDLAREATSGDCYCSKQEMVRVDKPGDDADWDGTEFFRDLHNEQDDDEDLEDHLERDEDRAALGEPVMATVRSDDGAVEAQFDARRWLALATPEEIVSLATENFGPGECSDQLAYESCDDAAVQGVYSYIEAYNRARPDSEHIGVSVTVNRESAVAWLKLARASVADELPGAGAT